MEETKERPRSINPEEAAEKGIDEEPQRRDVWRPPISMNPWARAFDADQLPDEPYMGSNKRPTAPLPYPDPADIPPQPEGRNPTPTMRP